MGRLKETEYFGEIIIQDNPKNIGSQKSPVKVYCKEAVEIMAIVGHGRYHEGFLSLYSLLDAWRYMDRNTEIGTYFTLDENQIIEEGRKQEEREQWCAFKKRELNKLVKVNINEGSPIPFCRSGSETRILKTRLGAKAKIWQKHRERGQCHRKI